MDDLGQYELILKKAFVSFASEKLGKPFVIDESNKAALSCIFSHLVLKTVQEHHQDSFGSKISLKKGFYVFGDLGSGKSSLMRLLSEFMRENHAKTFKFVTSLDICNHYKQTGSIDRFTYNEDGVLQYPASICIDELGREPRTVDNYGTKLDVISQVLQARYLIWQNSGVLTHFITNLSFAELKSVYGDFIEERIVEMCNVIELNGKSRRY